MTWPIVLTAMGTIGSILLGYLGLRRSRKADDALNTATLVQIAFEGNKTLVERLQAEVMMIDCNNRAAVQQLVDGLVEQGVIQAIDVTNECEGNP